MLPDAAAAAYYADQQRLMTATLGLTGAVWRDMGPDFDASWRRVGPRALLVTQSAQLGAARAADPYLTRVLPELDIADDPVGRVSASAFVGVAGDGRPVTSLLDGAVVASKRAVAVGASTSDALAVGGRWLDMAVKTVIADTARGAVGVAMTARPAVTGWVRLLELPCCPRCAVLGGKFFKVNQGFQRHPRCDCRHIPATENIAGDIATDPRAAYEAGQVVGLTDAQRKALDDGADFAQVVNSRRGMSTAGSLATREAARRTQRLSPEGIYTQARDRDEAVRLLRENGYLT